LHFFVRWQAESELAQLADDKEVRRRVNVLWKQHIFGTGEVDPNKPVHVFRRTPLKHRRKNDPPEVLYIVHWNIEPAFIIIFCFCFFLSLSLSLQKVYMCAHFFVLTLNSANE
jgi:hypothetical protein